MGRYVSNVSISGNPGTVSGIQRSISNGKINIYTDADGNNKNIAPILFNGEITVYFNLHDSVGFNHSSDDANIDYVLIKINGTTIYTYHESWWVNGDKSFTIPNLSPYQKTVNSSVAAAQDISVYFHFEDGKGGEEYSIGTFNFVAPQYNNLVITTTPRKTSFYKNELFRYDGLVVKGYYYYQYSGVGYYETITNPGVISPDMSTVGYKTVYVNFGGRQTSYSISVYGVSSYTFGSSQREYLRNDVDSFNVLFPITVNITYGDGTTESKTLTDDNYVLDETYTTSDKDIIYNITVGCTASKTGDILTTIYQVRSEEATSISITTEPTKKVYNGGESADLTGIVVQSNYPHSDSYTLPSNKYSLSVFSTSSVGVKTATILHTTNSGTNLTTSYTYYVSGMISASVDLSLVNTPGTEKYYRTTYLYGYLNDINNDLASILGRIRMIYTTRTFSSDGTYTDSNAIASANEISVENKQAVSGDNTYSVNISKSTILITSTFLIRTYNYERLEISGARSIVYYGVNNTVQITPDLKVYGVDTSSNARTELEYGTQYSVSPSVDSEYVLGQNTVRFTSLENGIYTEISVNCIEDSPAANATVTTSGSLDKTAINSKYFYSVGETIGLNNLFLIISEMNSGLVNYTITSDNYEKRLYRTVGGVEYDKSSLTFNDNDVTGDYVLELSFSDLKVTYPIVLDYVDSITIDNQTTKLVYKAGEQLDLTTINGTITYASGHTRNINSNDIASYTHTFVKSDTSTSTSETEELTLVICGIDTDIEFTIICIKSAVINLTKTNYNIHDSLSISSIVVTYSDDTTTKTLNSSEIASIEWLDGANEFNINDMVFSDIRTTNEFTLDGTYTEASMSVSISKDITIRALKQIKIVNASSVEITKVVLDYNSIIGDLVETYFLYPIFNDGTTLSGIETIGNIYATNETILNEVYLKNRTQCYVPYNWIVNGEIIDTIKHNFTLYCMQLVGLSLSWNTLDNTHYVDDTLNMNVISNVVASYSALLSGESDDSNLRRTENLSYDDLSYVINNQPINNFVYTLTASGTYTLIASYSPYQNDNKTETTILSIEVEDVFLEDLTITYSGATSFIEEQSIINELEDDLTVVANYNNANVSILFDNLSFYEKVNNEYVEFIANKRLTTDDNNKDIYVMFGGVYKKITTISVAAKALSNITVIEQPEKTTFTIGDVITLKGIIVRAYFDNNTSDLVDYNDLVITGVDTTNPITQIIEPLGRVATVSYTYGGVSKTAQVNLALAYPKIKSLRINTSYVVTVYKDGDTFDSSGLRVYALFENGYEELLESTDYTVDSSAFTNNTTIAIPTNTETNKKDYGLRFVPVTATNPYDNTDTILDNTNYKITLIGNSTIEQTWLRFTDNIDYQNYNVGDIYNAKGVEFWVRDGDNNEYKVNFSTNPAIGTVLRNSQKVNIIVTFENTTSQSYTINVNTNYSDNNVNTIDYTIAIGDINGNLFTTITHGDTDISLGVKDNGEIVYPLFKSADVSIDTNVVHSNTLGFNILNYQMSEASSKCIGYMDFGLQDGYGNVIKNAHVVLFDDYTNPINADGNVTVKFPHYVAGEADKINLCRFGIIYNKHLFVSGNSAFKNCDWHSESINVSQTENYTGDSTSDYTYFSDLDYCFYGTDDTAIIGYDIYRDGDLITIKESSRTQATLYRREAKMITAIDSQGNRIEGYYEDAYPSFDINFNGGDGALSNRSIINFMGDTLFLTKNGLKVLSSKDTTYNKEKIVYDVSTYINPRILNENLEDAYLYTFKEKLLLKTKRGVYVGEYSLRNTNNEYEWYFLDNINADLFFEYEDELYFMNDSGELCKFSYDEKLFKDNSRAFIGVGGTLLSIDEANDYIITNQEYNDYIQENSEFHLIEGATQDTLIHANLGVFIETRERERLASTDSSFNPLTYTGLIDDVNNTIEIKKYNSNNEYDAVETSKANDLFLLDRYVYVDLIDGVSINKAPIPNTPYRLVKASNELFDNKYYLVDIKTNERANLSQTKELRISFIISDLEITKITNISSQGTGKKFQLLGDHDRILDLITYNNYSGSYKGVITKQDNVKAFYITKPYDMQTILYEKTVWQWAIVNDTELASYMDIGYLTSRKQGDYSLVIKSASGARAYSYDDSKFSFDKIQFTSDKLPHIYNRYRVLPGVGFIRFLFKNFEESNIVLDQLSLIYTISQSIKGVK